VEANPEVHYREQSAQLAALVRRRAERAAEYSATVRRLG
jgi:hypothetical protein